MIKAMILAAGFGTRLKPITDNIPKALVEVRGKTLLEITIERLKSVGIEHIVINTHYLAKQIEDFIKSKNKFDIQIDLIFENEILDTGGGIKNAKSFLEDSEMFLVHNVDIVSDINLNKMIDFHKENQCLVSLSVSNRSSGRYFLFNQFKELSGWGNLKTTEEIITKKNVGLAKRAFNGIHIISPKIFDLINSQGKFSIIPTYLELSKTQIIKGFEDVNTFWNDVGKISDLEKVRKNIAF